jgi:rhamnose utilization protein RhaD (predicted bifunctional aldolase and dehydrogenase)
LGDSDRRGIEVTEALRDLVELSRELGKPEAELAILAEGNTSIRADEDSFWIKASGHSLRDAGEDCFVRTQFGPLRDAMDGPSLGDDAIRGVLKEATVEGKEGVLPSVEAFMHAFLLSLPDVEAVGHVHPISLLGILCSNDAERLSRLRLFPDEIVLCGPRACYVGYHDPGLVLAQEIRNAVLAYVADVGEPPKTIWLQNHGLIATGKNIRQVLSAILMQDKAARVLSGALLSDKEIVGLTGEQIARIHTRPDEHYRQRLLWGHSSAEDKGAGP